MFQAGINQSFPNDTAGPEIGEKPVISLKRFDRVHFHTFKE
jgi:hypothetical protein